jgi:hypothetical protein
MIETQNIEYKAQFSLYRILPHMEEILKPQLKKVYLGWEQFFPRWHRNLPRLFTLYADVYSDRYDLFFIWKLQLSASRISGWASQMQYSNKDHCHEK